MRVLFYNFKLNKFFSKLFNKLLSLLFILLLVTSNKSYSQVQINLVRKRGLIQLAQIVLEAQANLTSLVVQVAGTSTVNENELQEVKQALTVVDNAFQEFNNLMQEVDVQNKLSSTLISNAQSTQIYFAGQLKNVIDYLNGDAFDTDLLALEYLRESQINLNLSNTGKETLGVLDGEIKNVFQKQVDTKKGVPTKFEIPGGYTGAAGFVDVIAPATDSADAGLTGILDASFEVTESLLGARARILHTIALYHKNLSFFHKATAFFKKNQKVKSSCKRTKIICESGIYKLHSDLSGGVIINADNVTIDLNGCTLFADLYPAVIVVAGRTGITIKNGSICGGKEAPESPAGILVQEGSEFLKIEDVVFLRCKKAIKCKGQEDLPVSDCQVKNCIFTSNEKAASLSYTEKIGFHDCDISNCFYKKISSKQRL